MRRLTDLGRPPQGQGLLADTLVYAGPNLVVIDGASRATDDALLAAVYDYALTKSHVSEISPDIWEPAVIRDPAKARAALTRAAGGKYSYRQLEAYTDQIARRLLGVPIVSKVTRWGVQQEAVYLEYSQERLASHAVDPWRIKDALGARNVSASGGVIEFSGQNIVIDPSGRFKSEKELGRTMVEASGSGSGAYLSDLVDMERCYRTPPENLNYFMYRDQDGS